MFRLVRFFSIASLIAFVGLTLFLSEFYRSEAVAELISIGETKNEALTQAFANSLWRQFKPFVQSASGMTPEELRNDPNIDNLNAAVLAQTYGLSVVKVKVYNLKGLTVFSTQATQIGEDKGANAGFLSAAGGVSASELTHRDTFSAFEQEVIDRDLLSSYVPIREGAQVVAVFEVYDDVTPLLAEIDETQRRLVLGVVAGLAVLYLILLAIVARAEAIMRRQQRELLYSQAQLAAVLNTIGESIITVDPAGSIVMVNQEMRDVWGYQDGELEGHSMAKLLAEKDGDALFGSVKRYLASGNLREFGKRLRLQGVKKNGASFPLEGRIVETQVGEKMLLFTIALRDLTPREE